MLKSYFRALEQFRFRALLCIVLIIIVLQAIGDVAGIAVELLTGLMVAGTFHVTAKTSGLALPGIAVTLIWLVLSLGSHLGFQGLEGLYLLDTLVVIFLLAWCTFSALFREAKSDADALAGAIFGYFLLAFFWSTLFSALEAWRPGSFALSDVGDVGGQFFYFSLVTITTLGYGDILPLSNAARVLAGLESTIGTLYLAILIGRIVSSLKLRRDQSNADSE